MNFFLKSESSRASNILIILSSYVVFSILKQQPMKLKLNIHKNRCKTFYYWSKNNQKS